MENYTITPKVDQTQEFIEISNDFSNPLEIVREAISNSFDAKATKIEFYFDVTKLYGEKIFKSKYLIMVQGWIKTTTSIF